MSFAGDVHNLGRYDVLSKCIVAGNMILSTACQTKHDTSFMLFQTSKMELSILFLLLKQLNKPSKSMLN